MKIVQIPLCGNVNVIGHSSQSGIYGIVTGFYQPLYGRSNVETVYEFRLDGDVEQFLGRAVSHVYGIVIDFARQGFVPDFVGLFIDFIVEELTGGVVHDPESASAIVCVRIFFCQCFGNGGDIFGFRRFGFQDFGLGFCGCGIAAAAQRSEHCAGEKK